MGDTDSWNGRIVAPMPIPMHRWPIYLFFGGALGSMGGREGGKEGDWLTKEDLQNQLYGKETTYIQHMDIATTRK